MPRQSQATSSMIRGTKVLYFAEVCQYRARATIHPIKGITRVWLPMGLQKLPNRQLRYSKHDLHTQLLDCCYSLTSTFCAHSGYAGSAGTSQVSSGPVEAISSTLFCKVIQQHWQSVITKSTTDRWFSAGNEGNNNDNTQHLHGSLQLLLWHMNH